MNSPLVNWMHVISHLGSVAVAYALALPVENSLGKDAVLERKP